MAKGERTVESIFPPKRLLRPMSTSASAGRDAVEAYLSRVPPEMRRALQKLRQTIRAAAPDAEEVISYGMPAFRDHGSLVWYAAFSDHCSFFVGSVLTQRRFARELKPFAAGKGTVHFLPERPIPPGLVTRIVKARLAENRAPTRAKTRRAPRAKKGR